MVRVGQHGPRQIVRQGLDVSPGPDVRFQQPQESADGRVFMVGVGAGLAAINVRFRDVRQMMPLLVQLWMFATPVVYPSSLLSEPWRTLYGLNPMVGVVEGFRWALLGTDPPGSMLLLSTGVTLVLFVSGLYFFRYSERHFADVI